MVLPGLDLEFRQLRAFVRLVNRGSMTAAARDLGVAQSTMSEVVAALERALGTRLVTRRRGVHRVALEVRASVEVIANESVSTYLLPRSTLGQAPEARTGRGGARLSRN